MSKILISNFTLSPDHFPFDGVKTHNSELIQTLSESKYPVSLLLSADRLYRTHTLSPFNQFLLNNREWHLQSSILTKKRLKKRLFKSFIRRKLTHFDAKNLDLTSFPAWSGLDKIYMEELLKRKATTYYNMRKKLWQIPHFTDFNLFLQNYPFPVLVKNIPNILFIHDLIPLTHPHLVNFSPRSWFNLMKAMIKRYDRILAISEHTKLSLLTHFNVDEKKIDVVYQSVHSNAEQYSNVDTTAILNPLGLKPKEFLLYVARLEPRKNHLRLMEAYQYANVNMPLILVGRLDTHNLILPPGIKKLIESPQSTIKLNRQKKIVWLSEVSNLTLSALYQSAKGLIYPSEAEGFGLPIVEAFTYGCPVAAANTTAIPEVTGNAALLFNPYCIKDIAKAMTSLCRDTNLCTHLADLGQVRATYFSREEYRNRLLNTLSSYI
ncbi:glycosyltransferase family 4 protein [Legionella brunensis]|uniref:Glycosyltransferase n=1 Tax=Legionella brunensis TaxID=29422 RepID=A0A0W0SNH1_9GAMM|nr:glycosyltransferase family 1 protein [Legionella brunensis]KTC84912.1 glycosyltransferase [Legionella brunensis]